jgi:hypothetical protein
MRRFRFGRRGLAAGVGAVAALATAGGIAFATIPGPGYVYSACMLKGVGTIRLIDKCSPSSPPGSWRPPVPPRRGAELST